MCARAATRRPVEQLRAHRLADGSASRIASSEDAHITGYGIATRLLWPHNEEVTEHEIDGREHDQHEKDRCHQPERIDCEVAGKPARNGRSDRAHQPAYP